MSAGAGDAQAERLRQIEAGIAALEAQRGMLGDAVVDAALAGLRAQLRTAQALRLVSILFLDVVGSTALGRRLEPEEIHAVMDGALTRLSTVVQAHGGRVLQYAGDNLLAAFGADEVREDDAERAVRCGLALLDEGRRLGETVQRQHGHTGFDVRVGIHSGAVLLGGGVDGEGTIRGSAVNVAARLEQSAPPGGLLISVDTYRLTPGRFEVEDAQPLVVKGLEAPVLSYRVRRERPRQAQMLRRGAEGPAVPMVGRDAELASLSAVLQEVRHLRTPQRVTVIAEAGLGKTRLLAEFVARLSPATRVLHATSHPQARLQPYGLLRDLLFRHLGVQDSDTPEQARANFCARLAPVFGERTEEQAALLGQFIGLDFSASPSIAGILADVRQLQARALHALSGFLQGQIPASGAGPDGGEDEPALVLVLDDLHWSDDGSLDILEQLPRLVRAMPVLLLCAARPGLAERRPEWVDAGASPAATATPPRSLRLTGLDPADRQALARALLPDIDDPDLLQLLCVRTDGNPFYMEALVQMMVDQGVLQTDRRPWKLVPGRLQDLQVPTSLVGVLQALLDALEAPHRRTLQQASVVGAVFWEDALASLDARAPASLPVLGERSLALRRPTSAFEDTPEYAFRHHLLHEVTYGTVLKRDRREQHLRAARWLERRSAGREAEVAGLIADHYERAELPAQAVEHWARAAKAAADRQVDDAALAHADRALALDEALQAAAEGSGSEAGSDVEAQARGRRRFEMLRVRAGAMSRRGTMDQQQEAIAAMEAAAEQLDDDGLRLIAAQGRMQRMCLDAQFTEAVELGLKRLAQVRQADPREIARLRNVLVIAYARQGQIEAAREQIHLTLPLARSCGDLYLEASLLNNLGATYLDQGWLKESHEAFAQALEVYRRCGSRYGMAITMLNLGVLAEKRDLMSQARAQLEELITLCQQIGHRYIEALAHGNIGFTLLEIGEPQKAVDHARIGMAMARQDGDRYAEVVSLGSCTMAMTALERWAEAAELAQQASVGYLHHGLRSMSNACLGHRVWALAELGDETGARQALEDLRTEIEAHGSWAEAPEAAMTAYAALRSLGDPTADDMLDQAHAALLTQAEAVKEGPERERFFVARAGRRRVMQDWARRQAS